MRVAPDGTLLTDRSPIVTSKGIAALAVHFSVKLDDRQDRLPGIG